MAANADLLKELAQWSLMSSLERATIGAPQTYADWAKAKGLSARALQNWRKTPEFLELVGTLEAGRAALRPGSTVPAQALEAAIADGAEYRFVKAMDAITKGLEGGDAKFLQMYLQSEGKEFLEAARSQRESVLSELSDEELVSGFLKQVDPALVAGALARLGWTVRSPDQNPEPEGSDVQS